MVGSEGGGVGVQVGLSIVPPGEIPAAGPTPTEDLMALFKLCSQMAATCVKENGKGLSAVQVGVPWDLFVVNQIPLHLRADKANPWGYYIGCTYEPVGEGSVESVEGCLSLKDDKGKVRLYKLKRASKIHVRGRQLRDDPQGLRIEEVNYILELKTDAIVFQHEIDHARSVLISDNGVEVMLW